MKSQLLTHVCSLLCLAMIAGCSDSDSEQNELDQPSTKQDGNQEQDEMQGDDLSNPDLPEGESRTDQDLPPGDNEFEQDLAQSPLAGG